MASGGVAARLAANADTLMVQQTLLKLGFDPGKADDVGSVNVDQFQIELGCSLKTSHSPRAGISYYLEIVDEPGSVERPRDFIASPGTDRATGGEGRRAKTRASLTRRGVK